MILEPLGQSPTGELGPLGPAPAGELELGTPWPSSMGTLELHLWEIAARLPIFSSKLEGRNIVEEGN